MDSIHIRRYGQSLIDIFDIFDKVAKACSSSALGPATLAQKMPSYAIISTSWSFASACDSADVTDSTLGCYWNMPANYDSGAFETCHADDDLPMYFVCLLYAVRIS